MLRIKRYESEISPGFDNTSKLSSLQIGKQMLIKEDTIIHQNDIQLTSKKASKRCTVLCQLLFKAQLIFLLTCTLRLTSLIMSPIIFILFASS